MPQITPLVLGDAKAQGERGVNGGELVDHRVEVVRRSTRSPRGPGASEKTTHRPVTVERSAAIVWSRFGHPEGPSFGSHAARVQCASATCEPWEGTECPKGCGVRLVDVHAEKDQEWRERMDREDEERRVYRAERRARRDAERVAREAAARDDAVTS